MNTIIIYGDKKDTQIKNMLVQVLSKQFHVNLISATVAEFGDGETIINVIDTQVVEEIKTPNSILVLKNNAKINSLKQLDVSASVIVNSGNTKNISRLSKTLTRVYTCGFSSKDYVTFSSREEDKAVVALQRGITLSNGDVCEPMELPCSISGNIEDYSILASTLTLILLDIFNAGEST